MLDENSGRLYKKVEKNDDDYDYIEYTDRNYLVVSVDKDTSGRNLAVDNQLFEAFLASVEESANSNQFVATIVLELKMREIMKLFNKYFEAVENKNNTAEGSEDRKAAEAHIALKRIDLINGFKSFWENYIKTSLEKHHTPAKLNSFDLEGQEIDQISGQLMAKLGQGVDKGIITDLESCADSLFSWLPNGTQSAEQSPEDKVSNIKNGIVTLIRISKCPESS